MSLKKNSKRNRLADYLELSKSVISKPLPPVRQALGATMAIGVLGALQTVDAQVVYSGVQNIPCVLPAHNSACTVNIDGSGFPDLRITRNNVGFSFIQVDEVVGASLILNGFVGTATGIYNYPSALTAGTAIGPAGPWVFDPGGQANTIAENGGYPGAKWELTAGTERYLGIRATGPTRYGWVRIRVNAFADYTVVDWAYNNTANSPINAGQGLTSAAEVSVAGRVTSNDGRGISGASVAITESGGRLLTARTNAFGYFRIDGLSAGQTVVVTTSRKGFNFNSQVLTLSDNLEELMIVAEQ